MDYDLEHARCLRECVLPPLFSMISLIPGHDTIIPEVVIPGFENEKEQKKEEEEDVILAANENSLQRRM